MVSKDYTDEIVIKAFDEEVIRPANKYFSKLFDWQPILQPPSILYFISFCFSFNPNFCFSFYPNIFKSSFNHFHKFQNNSTIFNHFFCSFSVYYLLPYPHSSTTLASISKCVCLCFCYFLRLNFIKPIKSTINAPAKQPFWTSIRFARCGPIALIPKATIKAIPERVFQLILVSTRSMIRFLSVSSCTCSWDLYFSVWIHSQFLTTG